MQTSLIQISDKMASKELTSESEYETDREKKDVSCDIVKITLEV